MSNEFMKKMVADTRTKPRLTSIAVDPSAIAMAGNKSLGSAFAIMDDMARKADNIKMTNERNSILIQQEQMEQEFNNKFLSDPLVYQNEDKYNEMIQAYDGLIKSKQRLVLDSKYLSGDDIQKFNLDITKSSGDSLSKFQYNRNQAYIKDSVDNALLNVEQMKMAALAMDPNDTERLEKTYGMMKDTLSSLRDFGISESQVMQIMSQNIVEVETAQMSKKLERDILYNPNLNADQRFAKLNEYINNFTSDRNIDNLTDVYSKNFGIGDNAQAKEYFRNQLKVVAGRMESKSLPILDDIALKIRDQDHKDQVLALETEKELFKRTRQAEEDLVVAENNADPHALLKVGTGRESSVNFLFNGEIGDKGNAWDMLYGQSVEQTNKDGKVAIGAIPRARLNDLNNLITNGRKNGLSELEVYNNYVKPFIEEVKSEAGQEQVKAILQTTGVYDYSVIKGIESRESQQSREEFLTTVDSARNGSSLGKKFDISRLNRKTYTNIKNELQSKFGENADGYNTLLNTITYQSTTGVLNDKFGVRIDLKDPVSSMVENMNKSAEFKNYVYRTADHLKEVRDGGKNFMIVYPKKDKLIDSAIQTYTGKIPEKIIRDKTEEKTLDTDSKTKSKNQIAKEKLMKDYNGGN